MSKIVIGITLSVKVSWNKGRNFFVRIESLNIGEVTKKIKSFCFSYSECKYHAYHNRNSGIYQFLRWDHLFSKISRNCKTYVNKAITFLYTLGFSTSLYLSSTIWVNIKKMWPCGNSLWNSLEWRDFFSETIRN